jgi:hypothetical protein
MEHPLHGETVKGHDFVRYFIATMSDEILMTSLISEDGRRIEREWDVERCYYPGCQFLQESHDNVKLHGKGHKNRESMDKLEWFWGSLRAIVKDNPTATVRQVLKDGEVFQCGMEKCEKLFARDSSVSKHHMKVHSEETKEDWVAP